MKKSLKKSAVATHAILTTAAVLAIQAFPNSTYGQVLNKTKGENVQQSSRATDYFLKIKFSNQNTSIVGMLNGTPVYKNERSEYFTINTKTGDLIFVNNEDFAKYACCVYIKIGDIKGEKERSNASSDNPKGSQGENPLYAGKSKKNLSHIKFGGEIINDVQIVGVDKDGHTIHKNSRGETFYVDAATGDLVYVKL